MSWTRRQFVDMAFEEIGLANYAFELQPEQLQMALRRLDAMMATWNAKGIRLGYPLPGSPQNSELATETGVPDAANEAIYTNLAIRIAPTMGKAISAETKAAAKSGYDILMALAARPGQMQMPANFPAGAGHKQYRSAGYGPFLRPPREPLLAGQDGPIEFD